MLKQRLMSSAVIITTVSILLYLDANYSRLGAEGIWLLPLLLFFSMGTAWDITSMVKASGRPASRPPVLVATGIVTLSAIVPILWPLFGAVYPPDCPVGRLGWIVCGCIAATFVVLLAEMKRYRPEENGTIERTLLGVFVSTYVGVPMALMVSLRSLGDGNWGLAALLTMIAVTKSADAGAYFSGKTFGKHKLVPRLSPGKTWQGLAGGVLTATIVAFCCLQWLFPSVAGGAAGPLSTPSISALANPFLGSVCLGFLLAIAGLIGDLAESMVKRDSGAKDSGTLLPGLGGVWDVSDSLIAAVLPAFLCFVAGVAA